jgi:hypothetical protein
LCVKLVIYKDYVEMHGQQNTKFTVNNVVIYMSRNASKNICILVLAVVVSGCAVG